MDKEKLMEEVVTHEWILLMKEARNMGLTKSDVRKYIQSYKVNEAIALYSIKAVE